ncbi:MAG TPA: DUF2806 domain-containing protein [Terriglobales bacterium]|nr:DUF2806 domain-containing protein [Terriglobales bacterium]
MTDTSLIKLGDLGKPAIVLIEKISDAIGGVFKPYQIVRVAKAEAEAERIRAEAQIEVADLHRRALHRFFEEEAKRQSNIEEIIAKALPDLREKASPQDVQDDWITNFFDKCRIVSDQDMQRLWSRVLAGEANNPGAFSRRTVNLLADLDMRDAKLFTSLCGFDWVLGGIHVPLIFDLKAEIYNRSEINFASVSHLESFGLIHVSTPGGFSLSIASKKMTVYYYGKHLELAFPDANNELQVGHVRLTVAGEELAQICGSMPVEGFYDFVYEHWKRLVAGPQTEG